MTVATAAALRRSISTAIVAEAFGDEATIVARLIATEFASRLVAAQTDGTYLQLVRWTERTCERYGSLPHVAEMFRNACSIALGVLRRKNGSTFVEADLTVLEGSIAATLERLAESLRTDSAPVPDEIDATIAAFVLELDDADSLSAEHSRAVALWCRRLARRLALPDDQALFVARGGMLHDVGKTRTPKDILQAPRALSDAEFAIMRDHASIGGAMVREIERLRPFTALVRNHHERIDGTGYPDRLAGKEISLHVRIVTVADCFNAMIGRRPYRLPMSPAAALEQLVTHRGKQFDPLVVEAMVDIIEHPDDEPASGTTGPMRP